MIALFIILLYLGVGAIFGLVFVEHVKEFKERKPRTQEDYDNLSDWRMIDDMIGEKNVYRITFVMAVILWFPAQIYKLMNLGMKRLSQKTNNK